MKKGRKVIRITSVALGSVLALGTFSVLAGCGGGKKDALVLMTEELNGLFNPFYSTAGTDMDVVGQTQISMLNTDEEGHIAYGDDEPVVVKDYKQETRTEGSQTYTDYTFVLKNGIVFSDGVPLTMNDVMFNLYEYLDPAYTGSTTMYSTKIQGLKEYRLQDLSNGMTEDTITERAINYADMRREFLEGVYMGAGEKKKPTENEEGTYLLTPQEMRNVINGLDDNKVAEYGLDWDSYINATWTNGMINGKPVSTEQAKAQLRKDYDRVVGSENDFTDGLFYQELERDWQSAQATYAEAPYTNQKGKPQTNFSGVDFTKDPVLCFMAMEGLVEFKYKKVNGKDDYNQIESVTPLYSGVKTKEEALKNVYDRNVNSKFHYILMGWASGQELYDEFKANAKSIVMHESVGEGELLNKSISGIKSLGHLRPGQTAVDSVTIGTKNYTVAQEHDEYGRPVNGYDVLQITVEGTDPKAIWNFGFTVAPWHYYSDPTPEADLQVDIANEKYGVRWSDFDFQRDVIQGNAKNYTDPNGNTINYGNVIKTGVPLGAGPYVATNRSNNDFPSYGGFISNNIVYYKANKHFFESVEGQSENLHAPYVEKMRYQVVSSANAIAAIKSGSVDYVEPQLTKENYDALKKMKNVKEVDTWQLGYGYIGVNAKYITSLNARKAIMAAMDTTLAKSFYSTGSVATIYWPMSLVSWAYPRTQEVKPGDYINGTDDNNGRDYAKSYLSDKATTGEPTYEDRIALIKKYTEDAKTLDGFSNFKVTFTIAGSSLTEHPCYAVFQNAQKLLNECGWNITVSPDVNALTKLATGSLAVWAAAWGSTIDPDMYQVYHKNSTATSVLAWGYPEIIGNPLKYDKENGILTKLSDLIDQARTSLDEEYRAGVYKEAMGYVLDLAVELPVYQRKTMYGINTKVIDEDTLPATINPYTSPLSKIWEIKMK